MTENKRFMIDDAGTLIDMRTRETYDYVSDVCPLLNKLVKEKEQLQNDREALIDFIKMKFPKSWKHILEGF